MARAAVDRHERSKFKTERALWLEIAAKIKIAERLEERSGPGACGPFERDRVVVG